MTNDFCLIYEMGQPRLTGLWLLPTIYIKFEHNFKTFKKINKRGVHVPTVGTYSTFFQRTLSSLLPVGTLT